MEYKLIGFFGDSFVGKSHIIHTIVNRPSTKYTAYVTIGCKISHYEYRSINYSLCDIYPQYTFIKDSLSWLDKFSLYIFVCDVTNISSVNTIIDYYKLIKPKRYAIFINKTDLVSQNNIEKILKKIDENFSHPITYLTTVNNRKNLLNDFNSLVKSIF